MYRVNTPRFACSQQCQRTPLSVAPNCHSERHFPQTAGDLNLSNHLVMNSIKLHARCLSLFAECPDALNLLSAVNSILNMVQSKSWMRFPTSNSLKSLQTRNVNLHHRPCCRRKHTPALVLSAVITFLSHAHVTLGVAMGQTFKTFPPTHLRCLKSSNISTVESKRRTG